MKYDQYTLELRGPDAPQSAPFEIEACLVHKGGDLYEVFDVGVPGFLAPFRQGDTISATRQPSGNLSFVEVVQKSVNRRLRYKCKISVIKQDDLAALLHGYEGSNTHWDPTPALRAILDRVMEGGGNYVYEYSLLSLHLPPGFELTSSEAQCLRDGHELMVTAARLRFNQRKGAPDPSAHWVIKLPDRL
jgi:hypothetical protein